MESEYINDCLLIPSTDGTHLGHVISLSALASYAELLGAADIPETVELIKAMAGKRPEGLDSPGFWQPLFTDYKARNASDTETENSAKPMALAAEKPSLTPVQIHARRLLGVDTETAETMPKTLSARAVEPQLPDGLEEAVADARSRFRAEITRPTDGGSK